MTTTEISIIAGLIGTVFGAGSAWGYMRMKVNAHEIKVEAVMKRMELHEKDPIPHVQCPVHEAMLKSILSSLVDLKADIKTLSSEILVITRNLGGLSGKQE